MGSNFSSGLLAGVTAAVVWMAISLVVGIDAGTTGLWALVFLVVGTVGSFLISSVISKGKTGRRT